MDPSPTHPQIFDYCKFVYIYKAPYTETLYTTVITGVLLMNL